MDTKGHKVDQETKPQEVRKHPEPWADDLNPSHMAGQNVGAAPGSHEPAFPTAYDIKELNRSLGGRYGFTDDELRKIAILPEGRRLQEGATYLDLAESRPREITTDGQVTATGGHWYVPKDRTPYTLWNRMLGEEKPPAKGALQTPEK